MITCQLKGQNMKTSIYGYTELKPSNWAQMSLTARYYFIHKYGVHIWRQGKLSPATIKKLVDKAGIVHVSNISQVIH
jgi:hypothetical protein